MTDLNVEHDGHVALVEINRPPNNFFDVALIEGLVEVFEELDTEPRIRALVLASAGKHFCAGANFSSSEDQAARRERRLEDGNPLYAAAVRLFAWARADGEATIDTLAPIFRQRLKRS